MNQRPVSTLAGGGLILSEIEVSALGPRNKLEGKVHDLARLFDECVERCIVVTWVVVERDQPLDTRAVSKIERLRNGAVSPSQVSPVLRRAVLRIMDQKVDLGREVESRDPFAVVGKMPPT